MNKLIFLYSEKGTASFQFDLGDFSDLSNECKRPVPPISDTGIPLPSKPSEFFLRAFGFQYLTKGLKRTIFDFIFERKPKNPI